jgi:lysophospholipase L1-like esterase
MKYFLAVGCSHTEGVGVNPNEVYVECLSKDLGISCVNLGLSGSNSEYALEQIVKTLRGNELPKFIIAQWPNIYRKSFWKNNKRFFENINTGQNIFSQLLKQSENNFIQPWIQHILTADTLANASAIPVYHICLEHYKDQPVSVLDKEGIKLHMDLKKPGETWFFDSAGSDGIHHSAKCHQAWADRLLRIIKLGETNGT